MPRGPRLLAVLLVAFLLVGYVPASGYAAGAVDGDTGDEPGTSESKGALDVADDASSDDDGGEGDDADGSDGDDEADETDGNEDATVERVTDGTATDTAPDTTTTETVAETTTDDTTAETTTIEASADTAASDTSGGDSDDATTADKDGAAVADSVTDTDAADTESVTTGKDAAGSTESDVDGILASDGLADATGELLGSDETDQEDLAVADDGVTVSDIPEEVEDGVNDTTDDAEDAADDVEDTVDDTEDAVDDAEDEVEDAADDVEDTVDDTTGEVEEGVEDTASDVDDATNATELTDDAVETTDSVLDGTAGTLDHTELGATLAVEAPLDTVAVGTTVTVDDGSTGVDATVDVGGTAVTSVDGVRGTHEDRLQSIDADPAVTAGADESSGGDETTDGAGDTGTDGGSGVPMPDRTTGPGIAVGAILVGAALIARNAGTAAALSALGGSGGSLLATLVSVLRDWIGRVLGVFGYKRYSDDDPLEHETRERLYEFIRDSPGAYLTEISEETGVTMGTARYHLRILAFENLVASEEIRGRRRYVPVGAEWAELAAALHDETTARIVGTLASEGPASVSGLADRLDRDPSTISHHLDRLAEDGIVERERDGRAVVNRLAESARIALEDDATAAAGTPIASGAD